MSKIKVAVVGCGSISKHRHIPEYALNPNVEFVAFVDPIIERAEHYAQLHGGKAYSSYAEMLKEVPRSSTKTLFSSTTNGWEAS